MPDWKDIVLETIKETPSRDKAGAGFGMWLLQKTKDGKSVSVKVVAGSFYTHQVTGEKVYPKDGLGYRDFDSLRSIYPRL